MISFRISSNDNKEIFPIKLNDSNNILFDSENSLSGNGKNYNNNNNNSNNYNNNNTSFTGNTPISEALVLLQLLKVDMERVQMVKTAATTTTTLKFFIVLRLLL